MKKNIGVIAAAILAAAALTACGTSKTAETSAAESSAAAAETSAAESSEAAEETTGDLEDLTVGASPGLLLKNRGIYRLRSAEPGTGGR